MSSSLPSVSVVIPCLDAAATLGSQLEALSRQDYEGALEVIVADNGSTDESRAVAAEWAMRMPRFRAVDASDKPGRGHARNRAAAAASGELILSCDADDVVADSWVTAMERGLRDHDLVGGLIDFTLLNEGLPQPPISDKSLPMRFGFLRSASGGNFGIRADALRALGGWNESPTAGADDIELSWRAQLAGYDLGFVPDAVVQARMRRTTSDAVHQAYDGSRRLARTLREFFSQGLPIEALVVRGVAIVGRLVVTAPLALFSSRRRRDWVRSAAIGAGFVKGLRGG